MALKIYTYNGLTYQFDESAVPEGAVEVKPAATKKADERPANKARKSPANKGA